MRYVLVALGLLWFAVVLSDPIILITLGVCYVLVTVQDFLMNRSNP